MARRFSYDDDDDASYQPRTQPQEFYQSARGATTAAGYQVSSGAAYVPPREPSVSPAPDLHYQSSTPVDTSYHGSNHQYDYNSYSPHHHTGPAAPQNLIDSSPHRQPMQMAPPPAPPPHRDPHAMNLPPLPLQSHHRDGSAGSDGRPRAAAGLAGGTAIGAGAVAATAMDTGYHGAGYHGQNAYSDPFRDGADTDSMRAPGSSHMSTQDPFASYRNSYQDVTSGPALGVPSHNSYEMRPQSLNRGASFDPYGHGWHESERDLGDINPHDLADDDDDGFTNHKSRGMAGAGAGGFLGGMGSRDASGAYGQIPGGGEVEKSTWLQKQTSGNRRWKWIVAAIIGTVVVLAIIGGVIGGVIISKKNGSGAAADPDAGQDLDKNSPSIKALMNNKDLHKVFPAMDYTPYNAALYPECLTAKPSQDNVTKDVAVLSQLAPAIRLYGTDCNQTEMVLHALDKLDLKNSMKIWMGVYVIGNNQTTNDRQLGTMWDLLDKYGADPFAGVIVGNEMLLNGAYDDSKLAKLLDDVRSNMTSHGWKLSVSTADAGVSFSQGKNPASTKATDIIMANVHPFFAGVAIDKAADWTWKYTEDNDGGHGKEALIAEVGWPSGGGNLCTDDNGLQTKCGGPTDGAVASIDNVNKFLDTWTCQAMDKGTRYFMFEAFDEQWKDRYNKPGETWETQWGLMDSNRKLKAGITIPDCGGKQAVVGN